MTRTSQCTSWLKKSGEKGIFPYPEETERSFQTRIHDLLHAHSPKKKQHLPLHTLFNKKLKKELVDLAIYPDWLHYTYGKVYFWEGGALEVDPDLHPVLYLSKRFKKTNKIFFLPIEELLLHEICHAVRLGFEDPPYFEEQVAYTISSKRWRLYTTLLFSTPLARLLSIIICLTVMLFAYISPLFSIPLLMGYLIQYTTQIVKTHQLFANAKKKILLLFPDAEPRALLLRLTKEEIKNFAVQSKDALLEQIENKAAMSLRWKQILAQFPSPYF